MPEEIEETKTTKEKFNKPRVKEAIDNLTKQIDDLKIELEVWKERKKKLDANL